MHVVSSVFSVALIYMNFIKSSLVLGGVVLALTITDCPGYVATNVETTDNSISAALILRDEACNIYGGDLINLSLMVEIGRAHV